MSLERSLRVRRSLVSDAENIIEGINTICVEGGAFYVTHFIPDTIWKKVLYTPHEVPDHLLLVADWSGTFVGSCRLFPYPSHSYLRHVVELGIFVLEPYRRRGIGRCLLQAAISWARENSFEKVILSVFSKNEPARRLFESEDFYIEGVQVHQIKIHQIYDDLIWMARMLE